VGTHSDKTLQTRNEADVPDGASGDGSKKKTVLLSRRSVLGILGFQAAAGAALATTGLAAPKNFDPKCYNRGIKPEQLPDARAWLVTDPTTCVGCRNCEIICSLSHDNECRPSLARIHIRYDPTKTLTSLADIPDICRQCNMADCYLACQYDALVIDPKTGARIIDPEKCQNCGECFAACPWNMIVQNEDAERYTKCDLCGGDPQCVEFCPASAIKFIQLS
jgi:Fe-S-cluster-containing dehydrogenase component